MNLEYHDWLQTVVNLKWWIPNGLILPIGEGPWGRGWYFWGIIQLVNRLFKWELNQLCTMFSDTFLLTKINIIEMTLNCVLATQQMDLLTAQHQSTASAFFRITFGTLLYFRICNIN